MTVEISNSQDVEKTFYENYKQIYHTEPPQRMVELVSLRVVASAALGSVPKEHLLGKMGHGPAHLQDEFSTCVVPAGWNYQRGDRGSWILKKTENPPSKALSADTTAVEIELFRARFNSVVGEMGVLLERTALSTNIRERLDFSCALLDAQGGLVSNAPHIPVHLGALGLCVRSVSSFLDLRPGDIVVTNHPAYGGSHLPDVTLLAPVHDPSGLLIAYVANRAHHAEIGGLAPGSMPPNAARLTEEGVVIAPRILVRDGLVDWEGVEALFRREPWPSRNPMENLADLQAQWSALCHARGAMEKMAAYHGRESLHRAMEEIARQSDAAFQAMLDRFDWSRARHGEEFLDDGTRIAVELRRDGEKNLVIDFSGSSAQHPRNFNATPAIVTSAVLYVSRLLAGGDVPLNDGLLRRTTLVLGKGTLLSPIFPENAEDCPPVVAGNVETSQHLVHALLKAFGVVACSQGTMNNVLFGDAGFAHYETLGGGHGAMEGHAGLSGRHSHMTNTAITDPEILEERYPVRLIGFSIRPHSGGIGQWPGGNGLIREYEFLAPLTVSLLGSKRLRGPEGYHGGGMGARGRHLFRSPADADWRELPGVHTLNVKPGDRLRVETPGGGGWGR